MIYAWALEAELNGITSSFGYNFAIGFDRVIELKTEIERLKGSDWANRMSGDLATAYQRTGEWALEKLLARQLEETPKCGKGARRRRFVRHVAQVYKNYLPGLFHCYDKPEIPQTTNELEGKHGAVKHHVRRTSGRASTAGGSAETLGELLVAAVDVVKRIGFKELLKRLATVGLKAYDLARQKLREIREPARRYRSVQRNPQGHLDAILARWEESRV